MYFQFIGPAPDSFISQLAKYESPEDGSTAADENSIKISKLLIDPQLTKIHDVLIQG